MTDIIYCDFAKCPKCGRCKCQREGCGQAMRAEDCSRAWKLCRTNGPQFFETTLPQLIAEAKARKTHHREKRPGLGDRLESALTAFGLTQEKWKAWKETHGLPPTCCCVERKKWLNDFGETFGKTAAALVRLVMRG